MKRKNLLRNALLMAAFVASVIILSAQVYQSGNIYGQADNQTGAVDSLPVIDNTEGLAEFDRIIRRYDGNELYLSGDILFYENADSLSMPQERTSFIAITTPDIISYEIDSVQTIADETVTLMIDKREKNVVVMERDQELKQAIAKKSLAESLKEFRSYIHSIVVSNHGADRSLTIQFKEDAPANTSSYEIFYDPATYRVKKVRMLIADGDISSSPDDHDADDELVVIDENNNEVPTGYYARLKLNVYEVVYKIERKPEPGLIDIARFVSKGADGYVPVGAIKNYELIN